MSRKKMIVLACILCTFLLTGAIFRTVKIVTYNGEPLIDLDALIHSDETGKEGSDDSGTVVTPVPEPGKTDPDPAPQGPQTPEPLPTDGKAIIEIYDLSVRVEGYAFTYDRSSDSLKAASGRTFDDAIKDFPGKEIVIKDDYAEAHALKYVVAYLTERSGGTANISFDPDFGKEWGVSR